MENFKNIRKTVCESNILNFSDVKTDSLKPVDISKALTWWRSLSNDWKIVIICNHNYNYGRLGFHKITHFESIIKDIEAASIVDQELFFAECKAIKKFICSFYNGAYSIDDLSPIHYLENIEKLYCKYIKVQNIDAISSLLQLKLAELHETDLMSLKPFRDLKRLEHLTVEGTKIKSLEGIEGLMQLKHLNASLTLVSTLEPLRALENLEYLSCFQTSISSLEPIGKLEKLKTLYCFSNHVASLDALENYKLLENVNFSNTQVEDIVPLKNSTSLRKITIKGTRIPSDNIEILKGLLPDVIVTT